MNSFNHYAYGAIGDWMVRVVAGLDLDEAAPGYKHLVVHPQPGGTLTSARAELMTQYGRALSSWQLNGGRMTMDVRVPANTRATIRLPGATLGLAKEGASVVASAAGVTSARQDGTAVVVEAASGNFIFSYDMKKYEPRRREKTPQLNRRGRGEDAEEQRREQTWQFSALCSAIHQNLLLKGETS
ncbi:MAG: alpha-L-rhamnosidase [Gemmatimonadetes bacterium]|nr:alpha-L-rhamnosidase [Gemmatimonadota bacterium]